MESKYVFETCKALRPSDKPSVTLYCDICASWGFSRKKKQVLDIASKFNQKGYEVKLGFKAVKGSTGIFSIYFFNPNLKTRMLIFSNDKNEKNPGVFVGMNPTKFVDEIVDQIILNF